MGVQPISPAPAAVDKQQFHSGRPAYISSSSSCRYTTVSQWTSSLYLQLQQLSIYNSFTVDVQPISSAPAAVDIQQFHSGRPAYISSSSSCRYTTVSQWTSSLYLKLQQLSIYNSFTVDVQPISKASAASQWTSSLYLKLQQLSIYNSFTVDVQPISSAPAAVDIQQFHSGCPAYISSSSSCRYTTVSQWTSSLYLKLQQLSIYNSFTVDVQPISPAPAAVDIQQFHSGRPAYI